jgi:endoglucanase
MNRRQPSCFIVKCAFFSFILLSMATNVAAQSPAKKAVTPVDINGKLSISNSQLVNAKGETFQLKGLSLYDVAIVERLASSQNFAWFRDAWGVNVIRAAMYTERDWRFAGPTAENASRRAVQAAIDAGVYVVVDWHILTDGNPQKYKKEAIEYFKGMATDFGKYPNVIFEICNEPNGAGVDWAGAIRPYAEEVLAAIRPIAPDTLVIVGTPTWSQDLDQAIAAPLEDKCVLYACHFYAGSHHQELRDKVQRALQAGLPVFVSEWGSTLNTGDGDIFTDYTLDWFDFLNANHISSCVWSLSDKQEGSALLRYRARHPAPWADGDFTDAGLLARNMITGNKSATWFADNFETGGPYGGHWEVEGDVEVGQDKAGYKSDKAALIPVGGALSRSFDAHPFKNIKFNFIYKTKGKSVARVFYRSGEDWKELATLKPAANWSRAEIALPRECEGQAPLTLKVALVSGGSSSVLSFDDAELFAELAR